MAASMRDDASAARDDRNHFPARRIERVRRGVSGRCLRWCRSGGPSNFTAMSRLFSARALIGALASLMAVSTPMLAQGTKAPASATPANAEPRQASYVSSRMNDKPLPSTDRASDDKGVQYMIEFDELILTILPKHEFRAALKYKQALASKGAAMGREPQTKMTVYGSYVASGNSIRFIPDPKRGGEGLRILDGTFADGRINVPFDYRNGTVQRRATVLLLQDKSIY